MSIVISSQLRALCRVADLCTCPRFLSIGGASCLLEQMLHKHAPHIEAYACTCAYIMPPRAAILMQARADLPIHCPFAKVGTVIWGKIVPILERSLGRKFCNLTIQPADGKTSVMEGCWKHLVRQNKPFQRSISVHS